MVISHLGYLPDLGRWLLWGVVVLGVLGVLAVAWFIWLVKGWGCRAGKG